MVERGTIEEKTSLLALGVTDFVPGCLVQGEEALTLDQKALEAVFDWQHFVAMAADLVRGGKRLSAEPSYRYREASIKLELCFVNLRVTNASEEDAETRRQNKKYLLAEKPQVRLEDIFGSELVKKEVRLCIDNIRHPEKYRAIGVKLMTGILMYGAAGMGKTMFAKAMAFETNTAFISAAGSDFLTGGGVLKLEEMFHTARRKRPCILFIDEFDAISKNRGAFNMSIDQMAVLEKLLKEMDGLETDNDGVYVVAATNYPLESLDPAVARRFSARIQFPEPSLKDRETYLLWLLEKKNLRDNISERAARTLTHMMGRNRKNYSEVKKFIEQSMMQAAFQEKEVTEQFLFDRVHDEKDGSIREEKDEAQYTATAYHEAGHAVLQYHSGEKLEYVTIVSRGNYGGYAMSDPKYRTGQDFLNRIRIFFCGTRGGDALYGGAFQKGDGHQHRSRKRSAEGYPDCL